MTQRVCLEPKDRRPLVDQRLSKLIAEYQALRKETAEKLQELRNQMIKGAAQ